MVRGTQTPEKLKVRVFVRYRQSISKTYTADSSLQWGDLYPLAGTIALAAYVISECFWS